MRNKLALLIIFSLLSASLAAQEYSFPELKGYKRVMDYPVYVPENLWDFINGAADNYLAYDFIELHVAEYKKGKEVIKIEIYKHAGNTNAFGIYASERSPSFNFVNLGAQGYIVDGAVNFFKGDYYVKIRTFSKKTKTLGAAETLAYMTADALPGKAELPPALSQFPSEGKRVNEEAFINSNVLGHNFLNRAFRAFYRLDNDNFSVYLFQSDSRADNIKTVVAYLTSAGMDSDGQEEGKYAFADGYNGNIFLAWKDDRIVLITGLARDQTGLADRYISGILK